MGEDGAQAEGCIVESMTDAEKEKWAASHGIEFKEERGDYGGHLWRSTISKTCWIGYYSSRKDALDAAIECGGTYEGARKMMSAARG